MPVRAHRVPVTNSDSHTHPDSYTKSDIRQQPTLHLRLHLRLRHRRDTFSLRQRHHYPYDNAYRYTDRHPVGHSYSAPPSHADCDTERQRRVRATQAINLSTRMRVQTGNNVGIGGFIISGSAPKRCSSAPLDLR